MRKLEFALEDARETIIDLVPQQFAEILSSYNDCQSTIDFHKWQEVAVEKIIELIPESSIRETSVSRRANCPLCHHAALGSFGMYSDGFTLPLGLIRHLTGFGNVHQCKITEAAFELGRNYVKRHYGEAERAAETAAAEEKARLTASRRLTDTLYKVHPTEPPELIDEGYRSWFGKNRDTEGLGWAERRVKSLGFQKHVEGNVQSLEKQEADFVVYADVRSAKKITFNVFKLPITKGKKVLESRFDFYDSYKYDIEDKFEVRLKDALERLRRR